jgi:hypothetical protein
MNEEIEQELISKFTDRLTDISNFEYDLLEAQAVGFIALVRAYDARQLRELPKYIISEADGCGDEQCFYCYPELVLDENGKVIKIEDVEKLADEWEWK